MTNRIIVLGTLRSGTSLTAELVRLWGAYAGEKGDLWESDPNDQRGYGYMEYIPLQNLNDVLLGNNDRVPLADEVLVAKAAEPEHKAEALRLLKEMDAAAAQKQAESWVWKDARVPLTLPFWDKFWGEVIFVVTVRHPAETILSAAKTEDWDPENIPFSAGLAYWQYCMLQILAFTQKSPRKIFLAYDQLLNHPEQECARLCQFLDAECQLPADSAQARIETMLKPISKGQRHHNYQKALAEMEVATPEQRALYNFLRVKTLYPHEAYRPEDFALYPGWKEYLQMMEMLTAMSSGMQDS